MMIIKVLGKSAIWAVLGTAIGVGLFFAVSGI